MEYKKANTFGTTAFIAYGSFWLTLVFILVSKPFLLNAHAGETANALGLQVGNKGFAWYLLLWGVFSILMFVGTLKVNRVLQFVFATLIMLYGLLAVHFAYFSSPGKSGAVLKLAGIVGIICGSAAIYLAWAELMNEMYGKTIASHLAHGREGVLQVSGRSLKRHWPEQGRHDPRPLVSAGAASLYPAYPAPGYPGGPTVPCFRGRIVVGHR